MLHLREIREREEEDDVGRGRRLLHNHTPAAPGLDLLSIAAKNGMLFKKPVDQGQEGARTTRVRIVAFLASWMQLDAATVLRGRPY